MCLHGRALSRYVCLVQISTLLFAHLLRVAVAGFEHTSGAITTERQEAQRDKI